MEEIQKLLRQNGDNFMIYSDESDSDNETLTASNIKKYVRDNSILKVFNTEMAEDNFSLKKKNSKERLPTRRPDPNVYNRNALLARENRKKKKIYLETIEKELQLARKANRVLLKALKHQMKIRRQLEEEKMFFKGLIAERSGNVCFDQASESLSTSESETNMSFPVSNSFESLHFLNSDDGCEMTSCSSSILEGGTGSVCVDSTSDDLENEGSLQTTLFWDDIWGNRTNADYFITNDYSIAQKNNVLRDVNNDHCYVTNLDGFKTAEEDNLNGEILNKNDNCLHHTHGGFLEVFCPTCSIQPECRKPPLQLLDDKLQK